MQQFFITCLNFLLAWKFVILAMLCCTGPIRITFGSTITIPNRAWYIPKILPDQLSHFRNFVFCKTIYTIWKKSYQKPLAQVRTLKLDILKTESWMHMGHTANMIIKDIIHIFASISKNMHILLMGWRYRECCQSTWRFTCSGSSVNGI